MAPRRYVLPVRRVDLNADLGEEVTDDATLLTLVTSANVACGYDAGTRVTMRGVCAEAARLGVAVGAQLSYADRESFGRVSRDVAADLLTEQVADQVGTLATIAVEEGVAVSYLKPHGALYHRVRDDAEQAAAVLAGSGYLPVLGQPGSGVWQGTHVEFTGATGPSELSMTLRPPRLTAFALPDAASSW